MRSIDPRYKLILTYDVQPEMQDTYLQFMLGLLDVRTAGFNCAFDHGHQINGFKMQVNFILRDATNIQQIINQADHLLNLPVHHFARFRHHLRVVVVQLH